MNKEKIIANLEEALRLLKEYEFEHPPKEDKPEVPKTESAIAFIIGHTEKAGGAYSEYFKQNEYNFWLSRIDKFLNACTAYKMDSFVFDRNEGGITGAYRDADKYLQFYKNQCIIELHFNAFNKRATGVETLYVKDSAFEGILAKTVNDAMASSLKLTNRGAKDIKSGAAGYQNVTRISTYPSILIEPFFGDNESDCREFEKFEYHFYTHVVGAVKRSYESK